ncbi:MAG: 30S ribosomal protein S8 [Chlamydiia bacterium]|nr:30S ribosomal protein S8 [Chlamydiia bacterium]
MNDPIADLLTRIRNGMMAKHRYVDLNFSKMNVAIVTRLKATGYIESFLVSEEKRAIRVFLRYSKATRQCVISGLKRASKPGSRMYVKCEDIPYVKSGLGITLLSTSKGVIDGKAAKKEKVGGEVLCYVW